MTMLVSKISRGTVMDQIYIPKQRAPGLEAGTLVVIEPALLKAAEKPRLNYYKIVSLPPIKVAIIERIFEYFEQMAEVDNALVTGSFLEHGFEFGDVDVVAISDKKVDASGIENALSTELGLKVHVIAIGFKTLLKGISTDPLFEMLVSRFVAKRRVIFRVTREIRYKLLDLHLLNSELLIINFYFLTGREKYKFVRNLFAIAIFLDGGKISTETVDSRINRYFGKDAVKNIKENLADKNFLAKYKKFYAAVFKKIMAGIRDDSKQKQVA